MHLSIIAILVVLSVLIYRRFLFKRSSISYHFFFLGAAFMLLEFTNISKGALLFGATWQVNTLVISAILILALCANFLIAKFNFSETKGLYASLIAAVAVAFFLPLGAFNCLGNTEKAVFASIILNLPILFAGMIFAISFKKAAQKGRAFGSNIFGAATGGLLESVSFVTGINSVLLVVGGLYCLSLVFINDS